MSSTTGARPPLRRLRRAEFLPPDESVEIPYRFTPKLALRVGVLEPARARGLRGPALPPVGPAGPVGDALPHRGAEQPGPHHPHRGAARDDRGRKGSSPRDERARDHRPHLAAGPPKTWSRQLGELRRLAAVLKMSPRTVVALLRGKAGDPLTPVTIKSGSTALRPRTSSSTWTSSVVESTRPHSGTIHTRRSPRTSSATWARSPPHS